MNLLLNPSLEEGHYNYNGIPELQIPVHWLWWNSDESLPNPFDPAPHSVFRQPESRVLHYSELPPEEQSLFVLQGAYTWKVFKGHGSIYFRLMQAIDHVEPGLYRLTVNVFADLVQGYNADGSKIWANDPDGHDGLIRLPGTEWISLVPGRWNIITWDISVPFSNPLIIEVMGPFPLNNNGFFFDEFSLEPIQTSECRGEPREQYTRKVVVIPASATLARAVEIFTWAWQNGRMTVGGSYDDAGIGDLNNKTAILMDLPADQHPIFENWFDQWYPGTNVQFSGNIYLPWPVQTTNYVITSTFNAPRDYPPNYLHEGLDFGGALGTPIISILDGVIVRNQNTTTSGQPSRYGWHIVIDSGNGVYIWYCHLLEQSPLPVGRAVHAGDNIGKLGASGSVPVGPHLHITWQEYNNPNALDGYVVDKVIDPLPRLTRPRITLP